MSSPHHRPDFRQWLQGARLRTLPLAIAPVVLGTASAIWRESFDALLFGLTLVLAISIQVGVNFANDYSDGIRGTDQYRVGPPRLTGSGAANPRSVLALALIFFGLAALAGVVVVVVSQEWWLLLLGAGALIAAWTYTGGKTPYGYRGFGELVVFVFFGLVATVGTAYIQVGEIPWESWLTGSAAGFFASAVLLENNLRDIEQDTKADKRTLAVLIGKQSSRVTILVLLALPYLILGFFSALFIFAPAVFITGILTIAIGIIVWLARTPRDLILALQLTSLNALLYALGLGAAIAL